MERDEQFNNKRDPDYWASVGMAALLFGFISFVISIFGGYTVINSESTGSMTLAIIQSIIGLVSCLISAFGGMLAVWHYSKAFNLKLTLGKGALIGFITGAAIVIVSGVFQELWSLIDPDYTEKMMQSMIENLEAMDMPEEQKQQMIDGTAQQMQNGMLTTLLWGIPLYGMLNLLTGMLGVSLFARKKEI